MNIEARIEKIMDEQVISDRFRKREFVVLKIKLRFLMLTKPGKR